MHLVFVLEKVKGTSLKKLDLDSLHMILSIPCTYVKNTIILGASKIMKGSDIMHGKFA